MGGSELLQQDAPGKGIINSAAQAPDVAWQSINTLLMSIVERLPFVLAGVLVGLFFYLLAKAIRSAFLAATRRANLDERLRLLFSRLIVVGIVVLGIFAALTVIIPSFAFGDLVAGVGLTTFVIGFATRDILNNLLSGVLILWQHPFRIGDQIYVDKILGKVEYIGVRATSLRKDDGELVVIPNGIMYSGTLVIRGAGAMRRMTMNLKVGYADDVEEAKSIVRTAVSETVGVVAKPPARVYISELAAEGPNVTVEFWIDTSKDAPSDVYDRVASRVVRAMNRSGVEPYPPGALVVRSPETDEPVV